MKTEFICGVCEMKVSHQKESDEHRHTGEEKSLFDKNDESKLDTSNIHRLHIDELATKKPNIVIIGKIDNLVMYTETLDIVGELK